MTVARRMSGMKPALVSCLVLLALALAGCSGSGEVVTDAPSPTAASVETPSERPTTKPTEDVTAAETPAETAVAEAELPDFISDFDRVCTTQVGFGGAAPYEETPGLHPMVVFEEFKDEGNLLESSREFPAGWTVSEDGNFDDNSELAAVQLVACSVRVEATPNGTVCEFDSEGETLSLELVDGVYEVTVYEAATGEEVGAVTLEAATTECPFVVTVQEGDTQHFNKPTDDQMIVALRPFVER